MVFLPPNLKGSASIPTAAAVTSKETHEQPIKPSLSTEHCSRLLFMVSNPTDDNDIPRKVNLTDNTTNNLFNTIWCVDNGATHHVCCDILLFNIIHLKNLLELPGGSLAIVKHIGQVIFSPIFIQINACLSYTRIQV